jgi:hypothetical protein
VKHNPKQVRSTNDQAVLCPQGAAQMMLHLDEFTRSVVPTRGEYRVPGLHRLPCTFLTVL